MLNLVSCSRMCVPMFADNMAVRIEVHHVNSFALGPRPNFRRWLGFLRGWVFLRWGIFRGIRLWSGLSWRGFYWQLVGSMCHWRVAASCWFTWWWVGSTRLSMGAARSYLTRILDGFYWSFRIAASNNCQLLLRKMNIDVIYTYKIQNYVIKNMFSGKLLLLLRNRDASPTINDMHCLLNPLSTAIAIHLDVQLHYSSFLK